MPNLSISADSATARVLGPDFTLVTPAGRVLRCRQAPAPPAPQAVRNSFLTRAGMVAVSAAALGCYYYQLLQRAYAQGFEDGAASSSRGLPRPAGDDAGAIAQARERQIAQWDEAFP
jgi:hypothetical protein